MPEILTVEQLITTVLAIFGFLCTAIFILVSYLLRGWLSTQKEHGEIIGHMVDDMNSLKAVTQANSKAIGDMITNQTKALERMERGKRKECNVLST